mmetsp:Transcript_34459/g.97178  ORF Transcript_34459/g.97178 Transcript_34459/m.97178 type:complete len:328 (-) Transcript_34459:234-1217(-)|eukprot:CAMPEP_0119119134 /NCGR_PEP_ID=MMETSP1310-20130426/757_1 /TAXON_ID=464262 /ORGANISM="Genus nov. species nov., Strain RCC2339" /LENGTH=327 /DNA_ID=CAMNT_0007108551 /DNA_START=41 /DNA_END=1024 /DNA_ORIENTATION=+
MSKSAAVVELVEPPSDGVSALVYLDSKSLLSASWEGSVNLYDTALNARKLHVPHPKPVLDVSFADRTTAYSGGLGRTVRSIDLGTGGLQELGTHDQAVKGVEFCGSRGVLATGSWDRTVRLWDPRQPAPLVNTLPLPDRVFSMSLVGSKLVVATAGRHVLVYDLAQPSAALQRRESSLKFQTRCVACFPNGTGYAISSVDGRVAIEYFDGAEAVQAQKYAFKCHRRNENGVDTVYPVNALAFHPLFGTFASGGCDGVVNLWDPQNKKRLRAYPRFDTSVAALAFNTEGSQLAIAASYTYEEGERDHPTDKIFVRTLGESEAKPKARK